MKKLIGFLQKYNGYISIVVFALMFVYALGMATPAAVLKKYEECRTFYSGIMPYNNAILILSIVGLLISAFYFVLRNHVRTIYYISNFVWNGINTAFTLTSGIITFVGVGYYQAQYAALPFDEINAYFEGSTNHINSNPAVFLIGYLLGAVIIISLVPHILLLVDKVSLRTRYEKNKKAGIANPVTYNPKEAK